MTHPNDNITPDTTPSHETPTYKRLKFIVVFMGVLLVFGLAFIVTTIIYRAIAKGPSDPEMSNNEITQNEIKVFGDLTIYAPIGGVLKSVSGSGSTLFLHFETPEGDFVKVLNTENGEILGKIQVLPVK